MIAKKSESFFLEKISALLKKPSYESYQSCLKLSAETIASETKSSVIIAGKTGEQTLQVIASSKEAEGKTIPLSPLEKMVLTEDSELEEIGQATYKISYPLHVDTLPAGVMTIIAKKRIKKSDKLLKLAYLTADYAMDRLVNSFNSNRLAHDAKNAIIALGEIMNNKSQTERKLVEKMISQLQTLYKNYREMPFNDEKPGEYFTDSIQRFAETRKKTVERCKKWLAQIKSRNNKSSVPKACDRVEEILSYLKKPSAGFYPEEINLDNFISEIINEQRTLVASKTKLSFEPSFNRRTYVHRRSLEDSILNLILNASEAGASEIKIGTKERENFVDISVKDNAGGMPKDVVEKFGQQGNTTKQGGTGFGIWSSKENARLHGGNLYLIKTDSHGTEIVLSLPVYNESFNVNIGSRRFKKLAEMIADSKDFGDFILNPLNKRRKREEYYALYKYASYLSHYLEAVRESGDRTELNEAVRAVVEFQKRLRKAKPLLKRKAQNEPDFVMNPIIGVEKSRQVKANECLHIFSYYMAMHKGHLYTEIKDYCKAKKEFKRCTRISENRLEKAIALNNLGMIYEKSGSLNKSFETYETAERILITDNAFATNSGMQDIYYDSVIDKSYILIRMSRFDEARTLLHSLYKKFNLLWEKEKKQGYHLSSVLSNLSELYIREAEREKNAEKAGENYKRTKEYSELCLNIAKDSGFVKYEADALASLAIASYKAGENGREYKERAEKIMGLHNIKISPYLTRKLREI